MNKDIFKERVPISSLTWTKNEKLKRRNRQNYQRNAIIFLFIVKNSHTISHNGQWKRMSFQCNSINAMLHTTTIGVSYVKIHCAPEVKQVKPINFITFDRTWQRGLGLSPFLSISQTFFKWAAHVHSTVMHSIALFCTHTHQIHLCEVHLLQVRNKIYVPNITNKLCDFRVIYACLITFPLSLASLAPYYVCE